MLDTDCGGGGGGCLVASSRFQNRSVFRMVRAQTSGSEGDTCKGDREKHTESQEKG